MKWFAILLTLVACTNTTTKSVREYPAVGDTIEVTFAPGERMVVDEINKTRTQYKCHYTFNRITFEVIVNKEDIKQ